MTAGVDGLRQLDRLLASMRKLRQTLDLRSPSLPRRRAEAGPAQQADVAALLMLAGALLAMGRDAAAVRELQSGQGSTPLAPRRVPALDAAASHVTFLAAVCTVLPSLKSSRHKRLRDDLAEYASEPASRTPQALTEIARALDAALLLL